MSRALQIAFAVVTVISARAIVPADLKKLLDSGENIVIIDVRNASLFKRDHIPNAINVPASLVPQKKLPPLGRVIVCDEGLARDSAATQALVALNAKPGIKAEILEGGFAAWQALRGDSTKGAGVHEEELVQMTYDQLKKADPAAVVLVDLRKPRAQVRQSDSGALPPAPLTDLASEFPQAPVTKSPFNLPQTRQSSSSAAPPALVLIDDGDGSAQATARILKANGITRVVILAGGESILARHGQPGLQRQGAVQSVIPQAK